MVRPPDSWRFSLSAFPIPENPLPTPSAGVRITQVLGDCSAPGQVFIRDRGRAHRNDDRPEYPHASRVVPDRAAPTASVRASVLGTAAVLVSGLRTSWLIPCSGRVDHPR